MSEVVKDRSGAESLVQTLVDSQVDVCFANPGTSEMHFVAALDTNPEMRCVLGLFEGIVTGAADGYGRMSGLPAATLTHLGPGFGNGWANLHNAKKARTPVVNVVGDHATYHRKYDAPLTSDVEGVASPVSGWVKVSQSADDVAADGAEAVEAALKPPGQVATLILPADTAWNRTAATVKPASPSSAKAYDENAVDEVASVLMGNEPCVILMNGHITSDKSELADRIAQATGARVIMDTFIPRLQRGAGRAELLRLPYFGEQAAEVLEGPRHIILCSSQPPVTFFAYPDKPNWLTPEGCALHTLVERDQDVVGALGALAEKVGADGVEANLVTLERPELPKGELNPMSIGASLANQFPEDAIVVDEGGTCGGGATMLTRTCPPHDWLMLTGGSIGYGMPCATGAAVASPDRRVICLQADGGGMYTVQALWTQARERLPCTTIILSNRKYDILVGEYEKVGARPGPTAMSMLDLTDPNLNWVPLANGMGVEAEVASNLDELGNLLSNSFSQSAPFLIELLT